MPPRPGQNMASAIAVARAGKRPLDDGTDEPETRAKKWRAGHAPPQHNAFPQRPGRLDPDPRVQGSSPLGRGGLRQHQDGHSGSAISPVPRLGRRSEVDARRPDPQPLHLAPGNPRNPLDMRHPGLDVQTLGQAPQVLLNGNLDGIFTIVGTYSRLLEREKGLQAVVISKEPCDPRKPMATPHPANIPSRAVETTTTGTLTTPLETTTDDDIGRSPPQPARKIRRAPLINLCRVAYLRL
ncbi:hypothetical protein MAPG_07664 [Magnaporthiopsis poae ATCC 64411]|uniref:Uncharacterized protein n=1 Tax=Magnaporthiopsis poae (strain ATCC 64411 / 73-15) TaxID=644358 RepID=A0A0C4E598_MAGP6|nr:hypothetical protein MAPG_07664 [Magnaporthiopsis poae ATCC 64411]